MLLSVRMEHRRAGFLLCGHIDPEWVNVTTSPDTSKLSVRTLELMVRMPTGLFDVLDPRADEWIHATPQPCRVFGQRSD